MKIGYVRVSSTDQNTDRQMEAMKDEGVEEENIFREKISAKDNERPELKKMLAMLRKGDVVIVKSMDRLARSTRGFFQVWDEIKDKGAELFVIDVKMRLDSSPMTECLVTILAAFAQLERGMIRERQKEGIKLAAARGAYKGRQPDIEMHQKVIQLLRANISGLQIANMLGVNRLTVTNIKKKYQQPDGTYKDAK